MSLEVNHNPEIHWDSLFEKTTSLCPDHHTCCYATLTICIVAIPIILILLPYFGVCSHAASIGGVCITVGCGLGSVSFLQSCNNAASMIACSILLSLAFIIVGSLICSGHVPLYQIRPDAFVLMA